MFVHATVLYRGSPAFLMASGGVTWGDEKASEDLHTWEDSTLCLPRREVSNIFVANK